MNFLLSALEAIEARIAIVYHHHHAPSVSGRLRLYSHGPRYSQFRRYIHNNHLRSSGDIQSQIQHNEEVEYLDPAASEPLRTLQPQSIRNHDQFYPPLPPPRRNDALTSLPKHLYGRSNWNHRRQEIRHNLRVTVPPLEEDFGYEHEDTNKNAEGDLYRALRLGEPHLTLRAMARFTLKSDREHFNKTLMSIPATTFSEILRCLDPDHFMGPFSRIHNGLSPHYIRILKLPPLDENSYYGFARVFLSQIMTIMSARRLVSPLSLGDLRYILKCARAIGDGKVAQEVWDELTINGRGYLAPDLECYNHLFAVKCWTETHNPAQRYKLRITPSNFAPRQFFEPPAKFQGHRVGNGGIKMKLTLLFRNMLQAGVSGNEATFCYMMIAFAREADLEGVESVLKRVWEIDVQKITTSHNAEPRAKSYPKDSPFYPSSQLLYTIAHIYGINNEIPNALRLVDYISRQYSITIENDVWNELLSWTYILSIKRPSRWAGVDIPRDESESVGQLPKESVMNVWKTMMGEPYNVKPTIQMLDRVISNLLTRQNFGNALQLMEKARIVHIKNVVKLGEQLAVVKNRSVARDDSVFAETQTRMLHIMQIQLRRDREYIKKWVRVLIDYGSSMLKGSVEWQARNLPNIIERWQVFLPAVIRYRTDSGTVSFWSGSVNLNRYRQWVLRYGAPSGAQRRMERRKRVASKIGLTREDYLVDSLKRKREPIPKLETRVPEAKSRIRRGPLRRATRMRNL